MRAFRYPIRRRNSLALMALAAAMAATPSWAMDLLEAYQTAWEQDATVRAARAAADGQRERLPQARAQLMPNIVLSASRNRNDLSRTQENLLGQQTTTDDSYYSFNQSLQLRQPLYRKTQWAAWQQADYIVADADATLERELQNLGVRVTGTYMEALLAQDQLELVLKEGQVMRTQLEYARKTFKAGAGVRTDIDEAQARLDMNKAQELEARQHVEFTRRQLEVLLGRPAGELARLDVERLQLALPEPATLEAWVGMAEQGSPEILSLKARRESAQLEIEKSLGAHYPTLDAVAQVVRSGSESVTTPNSRYINHSVGVQLNVPLYAGGYASSVVRQAQAELLRVEETLEATRRDLGVRLHREFRGVTEGIPKVRALEQAVMSAEQLVKSSQRAFQAGSRTMVDVLNAEQQLQTVRRDLMQARYVYLISLVRLHALAGADRSVVVERINGWLTATAS